MIEERHHEVPASFETGLIDDGVIEKAGGLFQITRKLGHGDVLAARHGAKVGEGLGRVGVGTAVGSLGGVGFGELVFSVHGEGVDGDLAILGVRFQFELLG